MAGVERWLLPAACLLCDVAGPGPQGDALVCDLCRSAGSRCRSASASAAASRPSAIWNAASARTGPPGSTRVRSAVWLGRRAREAVHRLKYEGWWRVAEALAEAMRRLEPLTGQVSLIPVPLGAAPAARAGATIRASASRRRLAAGWAVPVRDRPARGGARETPTQTALTPGGASGQRGRRIRGARRARAALVLVDDVFTTGATLAEAAAALLGGGRGAGGGGDVCAGGSRLVALA